MNQTRIPWSGILAVLLVTALIAWSWWSRREPESEPPPPRAPIDLEPLRLRTRRVFAAGAMFKPGPVDPAAGFNKELCPLILIEQKPEEEAPFQFGVIQESRAGEFRVVPGPPTVYIDATAARVGNQEFPQYTYLWWMRLLEHSPVPWRVQAVRVTFDQDLIPRVWEVLCDSSGARIVYVSQALEKQAADVFGPPLPGRHHSVERGLDEWPDVAVVRVLNDAPEPLGPWIYIEQTDLEISTILCRCMPAQVRSFIDPIEYGAVPLRSVGGEDHLPLEFWLAGSAPREGTEAWNSALPAPPDAFERWLRLPPSWGGGEHEEGSDEPLRKTSPPATGSGS